MFARIHLISVLIAAFVLLVLVDVLLRRGRFKRIRALLQWIPLRDGRADSQVRMRIVAVAVRTAANWYASHSECLSRSLVSAILHRLYSGVPAEVVLGITQTPFSGHAWVEVNSAVIDDDTDVVRIFSIVDRLPGKTS